MFSFETNLCFPDPINGKYQLDWVGSGNEDVNFRIFHAYKEDGPWIDTLEEYVSGPSEEIDLLDANLNFVDPLFFKIVAHNLTTHAVVSTSTIFSSKSLPERTHFLRYKEMLRRWDLDIRRYIGAKTAYIFRLKSYGTPAKNVNPILGTPIGSENAGSYGKKFDGGYFPPILIKCGYTDEKGDATQTTQEQGATDVRQMTLLTMPFPIIKPYDIVVNPENNYRYIVKGPVKVPVFRSLPLKQIIPMSVLPFTDKAYKLQIP